MNHRPLIYRPLSIALILAIGLVLITSALSTYGLIRVGHVAARVDQNQRANTEALCALRSDYQARVVSGEQFLMKHPQGIPGISAQTIQQGIVQQQRTIHALRFLTCPGP